MFGSWNWVGGRYSMDSAIGLSTMVAIGAARFRDMRAGMHEMDEHFRKVLAQRTIPELESRVEPKLAHDSSTNALIRRYRRFRVAPAPK